MWPANVESKKEAEMGDAITIRYATERDRTAMARLAALDEERTPQGDALLAVVDGEPLAALPLDGGEAVADPFQPTADLVALLQVRARQDGLRQARTGRPVLRLARA
jgi:hypothetical protein